MFLDKNAAIYVRGGGKKTRRVWYKVGYEQREPTSPIQFHANRRKMGAAAKKKKKKKKQQRWNLARWTSDRILVYTFEATRLCQLETSTLRRFSKRTVKQPGENNEIDRDAREAKNVGNPMLR